MSIDGNNTAGFLAALRKEKGVKQQDVADYLCVSNKTISKWETGATIPDSFYLLKLATYYHVTTDELLKGELLTSLEHREIRSTGFSIVLLVQILCNFLQFVSMATLLLYSATANVFALSVSGAFLQSLAVLVSGFGFMKKRGFLRALLMTMFVLSVLEFFSFSVIAVLALWY